MSARQQNKLVALEHFAIDLNQDKELCNTCHLQSEISHLSASESVSATKKAHLQIFQLFKILSQTVTPYIILKTWHWVPPISCTLSAAKTSSSAGLNTGTTLLATFDLQELICTLPLWKCTSVQHHYLKIQEARSCATCKMGPTWLWKWTRNARMVSL